MIIIKNKKIKKIFILKKTSYQSFGLEGTYSEFSFQLKIILHQEHPYVGGSFYHGFLTSLYGHPIVSF